MLYRYLKLTFVCFGVACGGGDADTGPEADARPDPSCDPPALSFAWSATLDDPDDNQVAFDPDGSLVVAVSEMDGAPSYCAGLARFAGDGEEIWRHPYDPSPPPAENYAPCPSWWNALALGPNGAIVTFGDDVTGDPPGATDVVLRKHAGNGEASWTYYNQNAPDGLEGADKAAGVAVDPDGFIVAAGTVGSRPWVARFAPNGDPDWIWSGSVSGENAIDVEVAADGTAFVGITTGPDASPYRIVRFDSDGNETTIAELPLQVNLHMTSDGGLLFHTKSPSPRLIEIDAEGTTVSEEVIGLSVEDEHCHDLDVSTGAFASAIGPDDSIYLALGADYFDTTCPEFPFEEDYTVLARFTREGDLVSSPFVDAWDPDELTIGPDGEVAMILGDRLTAAAPLEGGQ